MDCFPDCICLNVPYAAVSEIEGHSRPGIAGRLGTQEWAALPFIPLAARLLMGVAHLRIIRRDGHWGVHVLLRRARSLP